MRSVKLALILLCLIAGFAPSAPVQAQVLCINPSASSYNGWGVTGTITSNAYGNYIQGAATTTLGGDTWIISEGTYDVRFWHGKARAIQSISVRIALSAVTTNRGELNIDLLRLPNTVLENKYAFTYPKVLASPEPHQFTFSATATDYLRVKLVLPENNGVAVLGLWIDQVCFYPASVDPTRTPITELETSTPLYTYTPTSSLTPTRTLVSTWTPPPTSTTGGPTDTLVPTWTAEHATVPSSLITTPEGFDNPGCIDPSNPCPLFPVPVFPDVSISTLTPVGVPDTLTPLPSITMRAYAVGGGITGTPYPVENMATSIAMMSTIGAPAAVFTNLEGTPTDLRQTTYEIGATIGGLFGFFRSTASGDWGRIGTIITFLIALIALNLMIRLVFFLVPIALTIIRIVIDVLNVLIPG